MGGGKFPFKVREIAQFRGKKQMWEKTAAMVRRIEKGDAEPMKE